MKIKNHDWLLYGMLACIVYAGDEALAMQMEADAIRAHNEGHGPYKKFCLGDDLMFAHTTGYNLEKPPMNNATLNRQLRDIIVSRALRDYNRDDKERLKGDLGTFGDTVYDHFFGKDEQAVLQLLSPVWHEMAEDISIACDGFAHNRPGSVEAFLPLSRPRPMPAGYKLEHADATITNTHPLFGAAQELARRHRELYEADRALAKHIEEILAKCRTMRQLADTWPEGMRYVHDADGPKVAPPEVQEINKVQLINERLGLK